MPHETRNLFIRAYRHIRSVVRQDTPPTDPQLATLARTILDDTYTDVVHKICDGIDQIDPFSLDPVVLEVRIPGEEYSKFLKVQVVDLSELTEQIVDKLRSTTQRPYLPYED